MKCTNELSIGMVNFNCNPLLLKISIESVLTKTAHFNKFYIVDNGSDNGNLELLKKYADQHEKIEVIYNKQKGIGASIGKGEGLNILLSLFKTEYGAFVENDGFMIKHAWDAYLLDFLIKKNHIIIGCGHPKLSNEVVTESLTTFSIFKTFELQKLNINFLPKGEGPNFQPGYDTGCELIEKIPSERADKLIFLSARKKEAKLFKDCIGTAEFWYNDHPVFAHFSRGAGHSSKINSNFYSKVKHFFQYYVYQHLPFVPKRFSAWNYFDSQKKLNLWIKICSNYQ